MFSLQIPRSSCGKSVNKAGTSWDKWLLGGGGRNLWEIFRHSINSSPAVLQGENDAANSIGWNCFMQICAGRSLGDLKGCWCVCVCRGWYSTERQTPSWAQTSSTFHGCRLLIRAFLGHRLLLFFNASDLGEACSLSSVSFIFSFEHLWQCAETFCQWGLLIWAKHMVFGSARPWSLPQTITGKVMCQSLALAVKHNIAAGNCCSLGQLNFINIHICLSSELVFTVWQCRGNPESLFDFHLSASPPFPLSLLCGHRLPTCKTEGLVGGWRVLSLCVPSWMLWGTRVFPCTSCFEVVVRLFRTCFSVWCSGQY